ncbi:hypothetical protein MEA186_24362 [Mesorhizobium amorphae CCNWGS0123]|uniref:Uncharacterized protein n=1 Tax=Mesorhizobium amorphae CCNWGS0123 TaxID=1082933 RepID=G6YFW8_9HYPH|nr:hypothetical protein MEA186_24362 [Mesorhizobium amorphae CCNWGS0123]
MTISDRQERFGHLVGEALILEVLDAQPAGGRKIGLGQGQHALYAQEK